MNQMVGMSFSFCISDIVSGKVAERDVAFISANTRAKTREHWEEVIKHYSESYWYNFPDEAREVAWRFINEGRVIQPRLEGRQINWVDAWVPKEKYNEIASRWYPSN